MYLFTHTNVQTVAEASAALAKGKTAVIAGGTDLLCSLRAMCSPVAPTSVVNLKTIPNMAYIKEEGGMLKIGALTKIADIAASSVVKGNYAALAQAAQSVSTPELRNAGTIGGNICQKPRCPYYRYEYNEFPCLRKVATGVCYSLLGVNTFHSIFGAVGGCIAVCPSDIAPVLVAMNGKIITNKKSAGWTAADFFQLPSDARREQINNLDADEIVTEVQVPTPASGTKSTYLKWAFRKAIDFPMVSVAAVATSAGGNVSSASIVLGGVYNLPKVATQAQDSIKGKAIDNTTATAAGEAAKTGATALPSSTTNPGNKYKIQIAGVMVKRALLAVK